MRRRQKEKRARGAWKRDRRGQKKERNTREERRGKRNIEKREERREKKEERRKHREERMKKEEERREERCTKEERQEKVRREKMTMNPPGDQNQNPGPRACDWNQNQDPALNLGQVTHAKDTDTKTQSPLFPEGTCVYSQNILVNRFCFVEDSAFQPESTPLARHAARWGSTRGPACFGKFVCFGVGACVMAQNENKKASMLFISVRICSVCNSPPQLSLIHI